MSEEAFSDAVGRVTDALEGESGSSLARILDRLVPENFGDGVPEEVSPELQFVSDVIAGADPALCEGLALEEESATPATHVGVSVLPDGLGQEPGVWIYEASGDGLDAETRGPGVVRRTPEATAAARLVAPVHPTGWMEGGPVAVVIEASEDAEATLSCPPLDLQVQPLTPAPGAVEETVDAMVLDLRQAATNAGFDPDALLTADVHSLDPWIRGVAAYLQMLDGPDNPNSIRNTLSGDAPLLEEGARDHEELNEVFNAVMARSGLLDELEGGVAVLTDAYDAFDGEHPVDGEAPQRGEAPEDSGAQTSPPDLPTPDPKPVSPETLDRLMTVESTIGEARTGPYGEWLEFSELAVGSIQTTLGLTGVGAPLAANLGLAGNAVAGMQIALEISQAMLPGNLGDIQVDASPTDYEEDRNDVGSWSADLAPRRRPGRDRGDQLPGQGPLQLLRGRFPAAQPHELLPPGEQRHRVDPERRLRRGLPDPRHALAARPGPGGGREKVLTAEDGWLLGLDPEPAPGTDPSGWQGPDPKLGSTKLTLRKEINGQEVAVFSGSFSEVAVLNLYQDAATTVSGEFRGIVDMAHDPVPPGDLVCDS